MLPRLRKSLYWMLGVVIGLVVLLVAAIVIAERLIDTPKVRAQLTNKLSEILNGQVSWTKLEIRLLPMPHAEVRGVHVALPNVLTAGVGMAQVKINLLPLFRGNAEVQSITLEQPNVDIWIVGENKKPEEKSPETSTPVALYRKLMRPALDAAARFTPATTLAIKHGRVACHLGQLPPFEATDFNLQMVTDSRGIALDASATGTHWSRVTINGRVEFADLSALVNMEGSQLKLQPLIDGMSGNLRESVVLANADAKLEARTDGHTDMRIALGLELPKATVRVRGRQLAVGPVRIAGSGRFIERDIDIALNEIHLGALVDAATAHLMLGGAQRAPKLDIAVRELDLSRLRDAVMTLASDRRPVTDYVARIHAGRVHDLRFSSEAATFSQLFALPNLRASAQLADARISVPILEREATDLMARAEFAGGVIKVDGVSARLGASQLRQAAVDIVLLKPMRLGRTRARASLVLQDLLPGLRTRSPLAKLLRPIPAITGIAETDVRNLTLRFDKPSKVTYDLSVSPRRLRIATEKLPDAVSVQDGSVRVTPKAITVDRVAIGMLGSRATVSGELTGFQGSNPQATARVANGLVTPKLFDWIWLRAALAERFKPAAALNFSAPRVHWSRAGLDVAAEATVNAGPSLSIELSKRDKIFTLRRASIKDRDSDANISLTKGESLIEVGFSGVLAARSLTGALGLPAAGYPGRVSGHIQATLDLTRPRRSTARGNLAGEHVDLLRFTGMPIKLERFNMQGDGNALQVRDLTVNWAEQKATIRGVVAREANGIEATLEMESPGIVIDALRGTPTAKPAGAPAADEKKTSSKWLGLWSLPVKGSVTLRTDFVQYGGYRVQGVRAAATLQHDAAAVNVTQASLCGISFPLSVRMTPSDFDATVNVTAKDQSLEGVVQCLTGAPVIMTGKFDMTSMLAAKGPPDRISESFAQYLAGRIEFSARDGQIRKMALLGNILSLKSVSNVLKGDVGLRGHGFEYRSIALGAKIGAGQVAIEQAALDSPALGMVATGTVKLENYDSRLTVLVAPFGKLDRIVRNTPVLGYVIGGTFTSIPVAVTGDIRKPQVAPLEPRAVGSEVMGVFERTFKLPGKVIEPLSTRTSD